MDMRTKMLAAIAASAAFASRVTAKSSDEEILGVYDELKASENPQPATLVAGVSGPALPYELIDAASVIGKFRGVQVQTATPVTIKGDDDIDRPGMKTEIVSLKAEHVLSAKRWNNGKVTITTIDGKRHEARA